jgi:polyferredoxin
VKGRIRRLKWVILVLTIGVYYIAPFLRWDRGPGEPNQAIRLDFEHGRLYWPTPSNSWPAQMSAKVISQPAAANANERA